MSHQWNAKLYDDAHRYVADLARDLISVLNPSPGERVLDLGCGTGRMSEWLIEAGAQVLAVDADPRMVEGAAQRCPSADVRQLDARALGDIRVDSVLSNAALHWIPDAEQVVRELARVLRAGQSSPTYTGRLVVEFGGFGNLATLCEAISAALARRGKSIDWPARWYFPRISQYAALLEGNGFLVTDARLVPRPTPLEHGERGLAQWVEQFLMSAIDVADPEALMAEVEDSCRATLWRGDHWVMDYVRIRVYAHLVA